MKRKERDFVAYYNAMWYQGFPISPGHEAVGRRAVWTSHIATTVKQCADLMGYYTAFETGNRTDAVIQTATGRPWAKVEWEWAQPCRPKVNELDKLAAAAKEAEVMVFIGYSHDTHHDDNLGKIQRIWKRVDTPLIVFLTTCSYHGHQRHFRELQTHYLRAGSHRVLRKQPALPWHVPDTRWEKQANGWE